jgi:alpha-beta hydrolase superfamily lysophospholipase
MMFAQRYPAYFDGIAICAPAMSVSSGATIAAAWDTQTYLSAAPADANGQSRLVGDLRAAGIHDRGLRYAAGQLECVAQDERNLVLQGQGCTLGQGGLQG